MKATSKLVGNTPTQEIDWDKPQLVVYDGHGDRFVVLTTGVRHDDKNFEGIVVASVGDAWGLGKYSFDWVKKSFESLPPNQQVILQNTSDEL
jgi:hypothetical protein